MRTQALEAQDAPAGGRAHLAAGEADQGQPTGLSLSAKLYLAGVYGAAAAAAALLVGAGAAPGREAVVAFAVLTPLTAAAQLFKVEGPNRHSYHAAPAFLLAAALVLDPPLLVPLVILAMLPEWARYRFPWYIQTFNIATYALNVLAAWAVFHAVGDGVDAVAHWRWVLAAALGAAAFTTLNHGLVALVLRLARGVGLRESGILAWESLGTDMTLLCMGVGMGALWTVNPPLMALGIAPLFLFYRALFVPQLQEEAYHDAKTGLLTPRKALEALNEEIARVQRSARPTAVIMADLDLMRNINNKMGHLAGDEVLRAVGGALRRSLRGDDVVGRFGGEEFLVVLPDTDAESALRVAERLRAAVASLSVTVADSAEPLKVTMSLGVAAFPDPCPDPARLLYHADMAVYRSKLNGRNRVSLASPEADEGEQDATSFRRTLESLVFALEARGAGFDGQTLRVTALSLAMAREMRIAESSAQWQDIERGSLLHDVGKIAVPSEVLYKQGPLTEEEWVQVKEHPEIGWAMLSRIETLAGAAEIVRAHHEHYDGSGYPRALAAAEIPLGARIFAVVDALDAMTSDRPYRPAQSESAAVAEIRRERGRQFDPAVVDALLKVLGRRDV